MAQVAESNKATKKNKIGRVNGAFGFVVERIDRLLMIEFIARKQLKINVDDDLTTEMIGVALCDHFAKNYKEESTVECDACLARSSDDLAECPFCGDTGEVDATLINGGTPKVASTSPKVQDETPAPVTAKTDAKKKETQEDKMATAQVNGTPKKSSALAKPEKGGTLMTVKTLDKKVEEVLRLKQAAAENYWELGRTILEINENNLWKLRTDEEGKPKYKGFDSFVHNELMISPQHAYRMIDVAREYTEKQVAKFGVSKLGLVLQAPKEDREEVMKTVESGASKQEVEQQVREIRKNKKFKRPTGKGKKQVSSAKGKPAERVAIATIIGRKTVKLFKKPASMKGLDFAQLPRAKRIGDLPFGRLELANDVVQYYGVQEDAGGQLVLVVETRREAAE